MSTAPTTKLSTKDILGIIFRGLTAILFTIGAFYIGLSIVWIGGEGGNFGNVIISPSGAALLLLIAATAGIIFGKKWVRVAAYIIGLAIFLEGGIEIYQGLHTDILQKPVSSNSTK